LVLEEKIWIFRKIWKKKKTLNQKKQT